MKKKLLLTFSFLIYLGTISGQPTIDSANFTPWHQETIYRNKCHAPPPATIVTGANTMWDFSGLITTITDSLVYVHPDTTGYVENNCYQYPCFLSPAKANFSIPHYNGSGNSGLMFEYTANGMIERGWCNGMSLIGCTSTQRFPFPLTYNDSSLNTYYGYGFSTYPTPGYTWTDSNVYNLKAVGYGSLILPNTTYNNSLLVYIIETRTEINTWFCPNGCTYTDTIFYWLVPNIQHPVLEINYPKISNAPNAFYISQITPGIKEITENNLVTLFPNPFHFSTSLELKFDFANFELKIYNAFGERVGNQKIISQITTINRNGLANGIYFYQITNGNRIITSGKLVIE